MKDIKFRAWGIKTFEDKHRMYDVIGMGNIDSSADPYGISYMEKDDEFNVYVASDNDEVDRLSDYTLMQFTGLKDKNGKEIYEGDIIIADWGYGASRPIKVILEEILYNGIECTISDEAEVIGNIHQNPELLTD